MSIKTQTNRNCHPDHRSAFHAYYDFEHVVANWEARLSAFDGQPVPAQEQADLVSDLLWMLKSDAPLPYHYPKEELKKAKARIISLINRIDDSVILSHPEINPYHAHFLISLKSTNQIRPVFEAGCCRLFNHDRVIAHEDHVDIVITRSRMDHGVFRFTGYLRSVLFNYLDQPFLFLRPNAASSQESELPLSLSAYSYYQAKIVTNHFWLFDCEVDPKAITEFSFRITTFDGFSLNTALCFEWQTPFRKIRTDQYSAILGKYTLRSDSNMIQVRPLCLRDRLVRHARFWRKPKIWISRHLCLLPLRKYDHCWLYHDCRGQPQDNGYFQFMHDIRQSDGIPRYYVINEDDFEKARKRYPQEVQQYLIPFGSFWHKLLYLKADIILTAYVETENYFPFLNGSYWCYKDVCSQHTLVYLQHGVLHAHMPWKYSRDRLNIDREVISTRFEGSNLIQNYRFRPEDLIPCGMPRYDNISCGSSGARRILYAPSWRKYTVAFEKHQWVASEQDFLDSLFYRESQRFLDSPALHALLEEHGYELDFKLHPIMNCYRQLYHSSSPRVHIMDTDVDESDYCLFISDFSSFTYDFVYRKEPILFFFPDKELFLAGMNSYRELDLPDEKAFGELVQDVPELISNLRTILENHCRPDPVFLERMDRFFYHYDNGQCKRLYQYLMMSRDT